MRAGKTPIRIALLAAVSLLSCTSIPVATKPQQAPQPSRSEPNREAVGVVTGIHGVSHLHRSLTRKDAVIVYGERLFEGDVLLTDDSRLHVRLHDGTRLELGEESSLQIEKLRFMPPNPLPSHPIIEGHDETVFRLNHGLVRITAEEVGERKRFGVKTANAFVTTNGPSEMFLVQLKGMRDLTIKVLKGKVGVSNVVTGETVHVPEGSGAVIKSTGAVSSTGPFTGRMVEFLESRTKI